MEFLRSEKLQKTIHAKHHARRHVTKDAHHCEIQRGSQKKKRETDSAKSCGVIHVVSCEPTGSDQTRETGGNTTKPYSTVQIPLKPWFSEGTRTITRVTSSKKIQTSTIWDTENPKSLNHTPPFKWFRLGDHCPMLLVTLPKKQNPFWTLVSCEPTGSDQTWETGGNRTKPCSTVKTHWKISFQRIPEPLQG